MKIHFNFTPRKGYNLRDKLFDLLNNEDFFKYLSHMVDKEVRMELRPAVKKGSKEAMYSFYYGAIIPLAMRAYSDLGYELIDETQTDYLLKAEFAKGVMMTPEGEQNYLLDKSKMTKERLTKYIADCLLHLEMNLGVKDPPNSEEYKNKISTGYAFRSVKNIKNN